MAAASRNARSHLHRLALAATLGLAATAALANHELEGRDIAAGERHYAAQCASCHGDNLEGQPDWQVPDADGVLPAPPHDESGHTWHHDTALLFDYVRLGGAETLKKLGVNGVVSGMPGFGEVMDDAAIYDVLAFIRSTWSPRAQAVQRARDPVHE